MVMILNIKNDESTLPFDALYHVKIFSKDQRQSQSVPRCCFASCESLSSSYDNRFLSPENRHWSLSPPIRPPWVPASSSTYNPRSCSFPVSLFRFIKDFHFSLQNSIFSIFYSVSASGSCSNFLFLF